MNMAGKKLIFTFLMICVIFFILPVFLTGCFEKSVNPDETLYFSFKTDCPQCKGFKLVKNDSGTLEKCPVCNGLGYVYEKPQGNYKSASSPQID